MRFKVLMFGALLLSASSISRGQCMRESEQRYVIPPAENMLLVVASQPQSPIQFEEAKLVLSAVNGAWGVTAHVRNNGTKAIRSFTPVIWTSLGTGGTLGGTEWSSGKVTDRLFMPGQIVKQDAEGPLIPLTAQLRDKLRLHGGMKAVFVLMVERVVFEDGSVYSDETTSKALQSHFARLAETVSVK